MFMIMSAAVVGTCGPSRNFTEIMGKILLLEFSVIVATLLLSLR